MPSINTIWSYTWSKTISVYTTDHKFVGSGKLSIQWESSSIKVEKTVQEEGQYPSSVQTKTYVTKGKILGKEWISYTLYELIAKPKKILINFLWPKENIEKILEKEWISYTLCQSIVNNIEKILKDNWISYALYELIVNLEETSIDPLRPKEVMIQSQEISSILDERKLALSPSNKVIYPDHQL